MSARFFVLFILRFFFFFKYTATTEIDTYCHTLSLHDARPISRRRTMSGTGNRTLSAMSDTPDGLEANARMDFVLAHDNRLRAEALDDGANMRAEDRKSTRLNSSH